MMRSKDFLIAHLVLMIILLLLLSFWYFSPQSSVWQQPLKQNQEVSSSFSNEMPNVIRMLQSVDFEVFGRVQGVFFRKVSAYVRFVLSYYTQEKGKVLGLKGWVMNTSKGTVVGTMQGKEEQIAEMKDWLRHTGSPMSRIEKCVFSNDRHISKEEFGDFSVKRGKKQV